MSRGNGTGILMAGLAVALAMFGGVAEAKKGGGKSATEQAQNIPIVNPAASPQIGTTEVPLKVGKKFKGAVADYAEVTTQVTGSAATYLDDISIRLSSPQGRTVFLVAPPTTSSAPDQSYGPFTETPNSPFDYCDDVPGMCRPDQTVFAPFAGTVRNEDLGLFYGARMKGTWMLRIIDANPARTGVLNLVRLRVKRAKPIEE